MISLWKWTLQSRNNKGLFDQLLKYLFISLNVFQFSGENEISSPAVEMRPETGVANVINILENSIRSSFDSGIEEPGPNEMQDQEAGVEIKEAPEDVKDLADSIATNIIHDVKENENIGENVIVDDKGEDINENVASVNEDLKINYQQSSKAKETEPLETIDPIVVDALGNLIKKDEETEDSNFQKDEKFTATFAAKDIVEEDKHTKEESHIAMENLDKKEQEADEKIPEVLNENDSLPPKGEELNVSIDPSTPLVDLEEKEKEIPRTPHPFSRIEVLRKQESEEQSHNSLKPNCHSPHENRDIDEEEIEEDEGELQKLSWDSDSDERIDLGLEDGTPLKVQV